MRPGALFPGDAAGRRRRDRVLLAIFVLALGLLVARAGRKEAGVLLNNQAFGERFLEARDPYVDPGRGERVHGPYPPSYALICVPLGLLPTRAARVAWALAQCGALAVLLALSKRRLRIHFPELLPHASVVAAAALLLVSRYLLRDMAAGGGNLLYGTLAILGLELALAGRQRGAGVLVALGLVLKPNLAPLCAFYALRRRWVVLGSALVSSVVLVLLPAALFGLEAYGALWSRWGRDLFAYLALVDLHAPEHVPAGFPVPENAMNQSLREAVFRLTRPPAPGGGPDVRLATLSVPAAALLARALVFLLAAWATAVALRARRGAGEWLAGLAFLALSILAAPISWKAHSAALLPFVYALVAIALAERHRGLGALLVLYYVLCGLLSQELTGKEAKVWLQAVSVVTWGNVALLCAGLLLVPRLGSREARKGVEEPRAC